MKGYDISDNELAKKHSRYRIGDAQRIERECVFRFHVCCLFQPTFGSYRKKPTFEAAMITLGWKGKSRTS